VGVDDYGDQARDFVDEQGGMEGEERADRLRDDVSGEGDMGDRARDAMDEFRGQDGDEDEDEFDR
jgi:hypothetical protein